MARGSGSMACGPRRTACATVQRCERRRAPASRVPRWRAPFDEGPRAMTQLDVRPHERMPARPSSRTRGPGRTSANAGRRHTPRRPRRARQDTNRPRGDHSSRTSRTLQVKMRGLSSVAGGGSSVGILTATRKATLVVRSAFACHAQLDARVGIEGRVGVGVQRFARPDRQGDCYKAAHSYDRRDPS
jgi:hypothetical protein